MSTVTAIKHDAGASVPAWAIYELPCLRIWRLYVGANRRELAQATGISLSMVTQIEQRGQRVSGRYVNRIAAALDMPAAILVAYGPLDRPAQPWARKAAIAFATRRLASVS